MEAKVKADLMLSHEESCHVTLLICSNLPWDN